MREKSYAYVTLPERVLGPTAVVAIGDRQFTFHRVQPVTEVPLAAYHVGRKG